MAGQPDPRGIRTRQEFGAQLTLLREAAGLTVRDVAKELKLPVSTVGGYLVGRHLPPLRFPDLLPDLVRACGVTDQDEIDRWVQALWRVRRGVSARRADADEAPYRGLASFEPEHAAWFHGREAVAAATVQRLVTTGTVIVVGPSGSGKSSLLRAGVVPALAGSATGEDPDTWTPIVMTPGSEPLATLASRCPEPVGDGVLLIVDQLEELFTLCTDPVERTRFLEATSSRGRLVAFGLRADFYSDALDHQPLAHLLQHNQIVLAPMTRDELRRAIVEPARSAGVAFEDGLVDLLLRDAAPSSTGPEAVAHDAGGLPLIEYALLATWARRRHGLLSVEAYRETGGIRAAVSTSAEDVYNRLTSPRQQAARQVFLRAVHISDHTADTRRRVSREDLLPDLSDPAVEELNQVLEPFIDARLLTSSADGIEITHEALLAEWPRLRSWIDDDRASLRIHRRLGDAAASWQDAGKDPQRIYHGTTLAAIRDWADDPAHRADLNALEREFLAACFASETAEQEAQRRRTRRLQLYVAVLAALAVLVAAVAGYAVRQRDVANRQRGVADQQRAFATAQRNAAVSRQVAIEADQTRGTDTALAAQLALAAYQISPTTQARSALLDAYLAPATTRVQTKGSVAQSVAVAPDGRIMATCGVSGSAQLWGMSDPGHPVALTSLATGTKSVLFTVAISPDGHTLAVGGSGNAKPPTLQLWDITDPSRPVLRAAADQAGPQTAPQTGAQTGSLAGFANTVYSVAFSPDGRTLAAGSADSTIRLWNITDPAKPTPEGGPLTGFTKAVQTVAFSPDGRLLAAGGKDTTVRLFDVSDPATPTPLGGPLTGASKTVFAVAFSPDRRTLAAGSADSNVRLWNVTDPARPAPRPAPLTGATTWINTLAFSPDGTELAAGSSDSRVWLWDPATGNQITSLPHPGPVTAAVFLPHTTIPTLATGASDGIVRLWRLPGPVIGAVAPKAFTTFITPQHRLISVSADGAARMWDVTDPRDPRRLGPDLTSPAGPDAFAGSLGVSKDGTVLAVGSNNGTIRLWDISSPEQPVAVPVVLTGPQAVVESIAFSPDGHTLAAGADENTIHLWDINDLRHPVPLPTLTGFTNYVFGVTFSPDGKILAAGSADSTVRLWNVAKPSAPTPLGQPLKELTHYVYAVEFSPDGKILAGGSADHTVQLWDMTNPAAPSTIGTPIAGPDNYIYSLAFSPDGHTLAAADGDGTVWLWDLTNATKPQTLATLTGSSQELLSVAYDPGRNILAASGTAPSIHLWDTDVGQVSTLICATAGEPITRAEWSHYVQDLPYTPPCPVR